MLHKGDVLFTLDPTPFQAKVDDLQAQIKAASQDALSLNAALSQSQAELSRAVAQRDQSRREYARYREGHAQGAFSDQMVDTRLQTWKADEASVSAAQAKVVQARNALDSVVKGKNTTVASLLAQLQKAQFQLENTVVRAPEDGYVSTVGLRPGTMSTALGMIPLMTFVPVEGAASREYGRGISPERPAASAQRRARGADVSGYPGHRLSRRSGRRAAGDWREPVPGAGQTADHRRAQYPWPGAGGAEGDRSAFCRIRSAAGATLEAAVYSDHLKELSLIRKILIRMKSWENYIYLDH
ncbi:auxiliary transport protein, MFP family [Klebsiella pneumoniae]|uniref:Auxiliary transport protein, MFP family n=1 Tax=Klebsiella pneumoniae TaxID=573 RepID=A0A2X1QIU7_KLEPN|nr:auxiliary transport protein, MFP family [Klebsiella pneumoniae]